MTTKTKKKPATQHRNPRSLTPIDPPRTGPLFEKEPKTKTAEQVIAEHDMAKRR